MSPKLDERISTLKGKLKELELRQQRIDARKRALQSRRVRNQDTAGCPLRRRVASRRHPEASPAPARRRPHPARRSRPVRGLTRAAAAPLNPVFCSVAPETQRPESPQLSVRKFPFRVLRPSR